MKPERRPIAMQCIYPFEWLARDKNPIARPFGCSRVDGFSYNVKIVGFKHLTEAWNSRHEAAVSISQVKISCLLRLQKPVRCEVALENHDRFCIAAMPNLTKRVEWIHQMIVNAHTEAISNRSSSLATS